jgi:hypothetical protein
MAADAPQRRLPILSSSPVVIQALELIGSHREVALASQLAREDLFDYVDKPKAIDDQEEAEFTLMRWSKLGRDILERHRCQVSRSPNGQSFVVLS